MSSEQETSHLTSADLRLLQDVLHEAGYSGNVSPPPRLHNIAARLLITLFRAGTRNPEELKKDLEMVFGRPQMPAPRYSRPLFNRFSIQGIPLPAASNPAPNIGSAELADVPLEVATELASRSLAVFKSDWAAKDPDDDQRTSAVSKAITRRADTDRIIKTAHLKRQRKEREQFCWRVT
ncbi:hypothetical protein GGE45_001367 [Rhizobium aethiopicum]|uniref:Uncharacterized protein n=2 Tax=Rhizobium aethiopicum TaxID=1138170 RepID=A0A7W6MGC1_9HYPH|nr:hypothetical protein [Rhizobium aethiopicum]MBB4191904.1 hypothetical protein [Rhizobium aethiopicum]MBB4579047.1 hypothetical protein [Rhizobium aethiopicum]